MAESANANLKLVRTNLKMALLQTFKIIADAKLSSIIRLSAIFVYILRNLFTSQRLF